VELGDNVEKNRCEAAILFSKSGFFKKIILD